MGGEDGEEGCGGHDGGWMGGDGWGMDGWMGEVYVVGSLRGEVCNLLVRSERCLMLRMVSVTE